MDGLSGFSKLSLSPGSGFGAGGRSFPVGKTACWYRNPTPQLYQQQPAPPSTTEMYQQLVKSTAQLQATQAGAATETASNATLASPEATAAVNSAYPVQYVPMSWADVYGNGSGGQAGVATSMGSQFQIGQGQDEAHQVWQSQSQEADSSSAPTVSANSSAYDGFLPAPAKPKPVTKGKAPKASTPAADPCGRCNACQYQSNTQVASSSQAPSPAASPAAKDSGIKLVRGGSGAGAGRGSGNTASTLKTATSTSKGVSNRGSPTSSSTGSAAAAAARGNSKTSGSQTSTRATAAPKGSKTATTAGNKKPGAGGPASKK